MTTIAWKDGYLVADTQLTLDSTRIKCTKIHRINDKLVIACAGDTDDENKAIQFFSLPEWRSQTPPKTKKKFECIVVCDSVPYFCTSSLYAVPVEHPHLALGSGWQYAMSAMHGGMTAKQAVQYASTFDVYTNNEVESFHVSEHQARPKKSKKPKAV